MSVVYRELTPEEIPRAFEIEAASYPADEAASLDSLRYRHTHASGAFLGLFLDGSLQGFVCGTIIKGQVLEDESMSVHEAEGTTLCVHSVVVSESIRRRGFASRMLRHYVKAVPMEYPHLEQIRLITKARLIHFYKDIIGFSFVQLWPYTHGKDPWFEMMMPLKRVHHFQADAFVVPGKKFSGNPAAVAVLPSHLPSPPDAWHHSVAKANNLSETAFVQHRFGSADESSNALSYNLRWFTPSTEVDLCGHATLATAFALWHSNLAILDALSLPYMDTESGGEIQTKPVSNEIRFHTKNSGVLIVHKTDSGVLMDFPADPPQKHWDKSAECWNDGIARALGLSSNRCKSVCKGKFDVLVDLLPEDFLQLHVEEKIDMDTLAKIPARGLVITCQGNPYNVTGNVDFTSRWFGPQSGVPEDPVTGSAHCMLAKYWEECLGKNKFRAYQASKRGGILEIQVSGERVQLGGDGGMFVSGIMTQNA